MSTMFSCLGEETHAAVEIGGILQEEKRQQTRIAGIEGIFTQVFFSVYVFGTLFSIYESLLDILLYLDISIYHHIR
jgi:hypothetical protein